MSILNKLKANQKPILLAEIGAYLHDLGKARFEFFDVHSRKPQNIWDTDKHNFPSIFPDNLRKALTQIKVKVCEEEVTLMDFIEKHHDKVEKGTRRKDCDIPSLIRLLYARWNGYDGMDSGLDKGKVANRENVGQVEDYTFIANAFGYEFKKLEKSELKILTDKLYEEVSDALEQFVKNDDIVQLREAIAKTEKYYTLFLGETRRPANDVTLWDHSYSVATLFKCAVAKNFLDCSNASFDSLDFNWNILSVNIDVLRLLSKGVKIGDVLGYWDKIGKALNEVKELIEVEYPIGNEIYRDTSGIFLLVPEIDLKEIKELILNTLENVEPELMPHIIVKKIGKKIPASNYKFDCSEKDIPKNIRDIRKGLEKDKQESLKKSLPEVRKEGFKEISFPTSSSRFPFNKFTDTWTDKKEICPICRLRSMDENSDGCKHCLGRRKGRSKIWLKQPKSTIWLDEVSDCNDRVALLIGCFILDNWLNGSFIKTMAIKFNGNNPPESKNPSPSRIRRCWETTEDFITNVIFEGILKNYDWGADPRGKRIQFRIEPKPNVPEGSTCDVDVEGVRLSPVCINESKGIFVSTINLELLEKFGNNVQQITKSLDEREIKLKFETDREWKNIFKIVEAKPAEEEFQDYLPYIRIYNFPEQFMMLLPAYDALDIAGKILEEYETRFSKVRDRFPFHLGIIAFHRKTPFYVVMDAGKRLIEAFKEKTKTLELKVCDDPKDVEDDKLGKSRELTLECLHYSSAQILYSPIPFKWRMSYSTGDPDQEDFWHPYIRVESSNLPKNLSFDYTGKGNYVIHVKEIKRDSKIKIEPSYFKLFYLENASARFKIDEDLKPLHDIHRLKDLWSRIEDKLKSKEWRKSQVYTFWEDVKMRRDYFWEDVRKRRDYGENNFEKFVKSNLINILKIHPQKDREMFDEFLQATKDNLLDLCLHWNLRIRKVKPTKEVGK